MKREITITLRYDPAIGNVNLNERVFELKQHRDPLMLQIVEEILKNYDDLMRKSDPGKRFCRRRKIRKRGYRKEPRHISTVFGMLNLQQKIL